MCSPKMGLTVQSISWFSFLSRLLLLVAASSSRYKMLKTIRAVMTSPRLTPRPLFFDSSSTIRWMCPVIWVPQYSPTLSMIGIVRRGPLRCVGAGWRKARRSMCQMFAIYLGGMTPSNPWVNMTLLTLRENIMPCDPFQANFFH